MTGPDETRKPILQGWAEGYLAMGWKIIPIHVIINGECTCRRGPAVCIIGKDAGKHPAVARWTTDFLSVPADAQRWWGDERSIPWSMGLVCGEKSGVWVFDMDPRNGGMESLEALEAEIGVLPQTLTATTGGGGKHFYFLVPEGERLKKGPLHSQLPGLDVQAEGAQVVLPPSTHASGSRYAWDGPLGVRTPIAEAPEALLKIIRSDRGTGTGNASGFSLDQVLREGVPEGSRNNALIKVATSLCRRIGVDEAYKIQMILASCETFNQQSLRPPLDIDEVKKTVQSAIDFVTSDPSGRMDALPEATRQWIERQAAAQGVSAPPVGGGGAPAPRATGEAPPEAPAEIRAGEGDPDDVRPAETPPVDAGGNGPVDGGAGPGDGSGDGGGAAGDPPDEDSLGPDGTPGMRSLSDNGNARRLIDYFGDDLRYTPGMEWYRWDGTAWQPDQEALSVTELCRALPVKITSEIASLPAGSPRAAELITHASRSRAAGTIRKVVALANTDPRIHVPSTQWDSQGHLLGVANGVVDLRTGQLIPPSRDQYITRRTEVAYNPNARDVRWEIFLDQITGGDKEFAFWLQKVVGYTLTGLTTEQKFFLVYGPPGSGKSTVLEVVRTLLGAYATSIQSEQIMEQKFGANKDEYYNAEIAGKRMIAVSELPEAQKMKEDSIKRLTGSDTMTGRFPAGRVFTFQPTGKLWIATNHRPRVTDQGMWRRMKAIPFLHIPQVVDPSLKPWLQNPEGALPAVMAWAVEGAMRWYAAGSIGKCSVVDEATAEYRENEDELGIFIREELRQMEGASVSMSDVHRAYANWLEDRNGEGTKPGPTNRLMRALGDRGFDIDGSGRTAVVAGWALAPRAVQSAPVVGNGMASLFARAR